MTGLFAVCLIAYLIGSIPFGLILTRLSGYGDIRNIGSGNIGATNVLRTGNKKLAAFTLLCDFLKGFIPCMAVFRYLTPPPSNEMYGFGLHIAILSVGVMGLFAVLGHIWPLWLKFKGGKGVATALGVIFALSYTLGMVFILCWLTVFSISRISSLSALCAFACTVLVAAILVFFTHFPLFNADFPYDNFIEATNHNIRGGGTIILSTCTIIAVLIFFTHRENIRRLLKGEEHVWRKK